jgi:hypothetical protein
MIVEQDGGKKTDSLIVSRDVALSCGPGSEFGDKCNEAWIGARFSTRSLIIAQETKDRIEINIILRELREFSKKNVCRLKNSIFLSSIFIPLNIILYLCCHLYNHFCF